MQCPQLTISLPRVKAVVPNRLVLVSASCPCSLLAVSPCYSRRLDQRETAQHNPHLSLSIVMGDNINASEIQSSQKHLLTTTRQTTCCRRFYTSSLFQYVQFNHNHLLQSCPPHHCIQKYTQTTTIYLFILSTITIIATSKKHHSPH